MTILTKANDKKKLLPITTPPIGAAPSAPPSNDPEAAAIIHARRKAQTTTCLVCLMAILVLLMGVLAGICFYRQYLREKVQRFNSFIPYSDRDVDFAENNWVNTHFRDGPTDSYNALRMIRGDDSDDDDDDSDEMSLSRSEEIRNFLNEIIKHVRSNFNNQLKDIRSMESEIGSLDDQAVHEKFFQEEVEIKDDDEDSYADIKVPDFKDGRSGRFIHDFKENQTTIVDEKSMRCFIYPLDYETIMPPVSLGDLFTKMQTGYYFPDTTTLNKKMHVVLPALEVDDDFVSTRTALLCGDKKIYRMEPLVSGVYKRSISEPLGEQGKFAEFNGKIILYDILNIAEVEASEKM